MIIPRLKILAVTLLGATFAIGATVTAAESLNPEGINPHQAAPRKRITQEQKKAAWEARKKKKAEIEARKAAEKAARPYDVKELEKSH